jgi:hypothetical protein
MYATGSQQAPAFCGFLLKSNNAFSMLLNPSSSAAVLARVTMPEDGHLRPKPVVEEFT